MSAVPGPRWAALAPPEEAGEVALVRALVHELAPWARTVAGTWLSAGEKARRDRLVRAVDQEAFTARRCLLRAVLAERLDTDPAAVTITAAPGPAGRHGKPGVPGLHFSLSASGEHVLLATGPRELGVDVEGVPDLATAQRMIGVLHPTEQRELARVRRSRRAAAVTTVWVRKESLLKAIGTGLSRDPSVDDVGAGRRSRQPVPGWRILDLDLGATCEDMRAALTVRVHSDRI